jgi:hypothetical protein
MPDLNTILAAISAIAAAIGVFIQHRRTPKLPEPAIPPVCTTILGVNMNGHVRDLPGYSRPPASMLRLGE